MVPVATGRASAAAAGCAAGDQVGVVEEAPEPAARAGPLARMVRTGRALAEAAE